jgi:hypothetical protein
VSGVATFAGAETGATVAGLAVMVAFGSGAVGTSPGTVVMTGAGLA